MVFFFNYGFQFPKQNSWFSKNGKWHQIERHNYFYEQITLFAKNFKRLGAINKMRKSPSIGWEIFYSKGSHFDCDKEIMSLHTWLTSGDCLLQMSSINTCVFGFIIFDYLFTYAFLSIYFTWVVSRTRR